MFLYSLPFDDKVVKTLNFVGLPIDEDEMKTKILQFNEIFNIITPKDDKRKFLEEINDLYSKDLTWLRVSTGDSTLLLWQMIKNKFGKVNDQSSDKITKFPLLPKVLKTARSLSTSSANIEQSFSAIKLLKTDLRNQLNEETLQALILIDQEFRDNNKEIVISDKVLDLYNQIRKKVNERKAGRNSQIESKEKGNAQDEEGKEEEKNVEKKKKRGRRRYNSRRINSANEEKRYR